jgi:hypothetical protein
MTEQNIDRLPELANGDPWLTHRGRFLDVSVLLEVGEHEYLIRIREGGVESVERGPFVMPRWTFALRASAEDWSKFWSASPQPGYHDLVAMMKFKRLQLDGDPYPFMTHIRYFKDLLGRLRTGAPS